MLIESIVIITCHMAVFATNFLAGLLLSGLFPKHIMSTRVRVLARSLEKQPCPHCVRGSALFNSCTIYDAYHIS